MQMAEDIQSPKQRLQVEVEVKGRKNMCTESALLWSGESYRALALFLVESLTGNLGSFILANLNQVKSTLQNVFVNTRVDLYLLQIDSNKLGEGLVYEVVDGSISFPHFYGPSRSFIPLPRDAVTKAEKLYLSGGQFSCSMLERAAKL